MKELKYTKIGDYYILDLKYPTAKPSYGKYGMMREDYLKKHKTGLWSRLILNGTLTEHLNEIDKTARVRIELMMPQLMKDAGITEKLKMTDQLKWVGLMNNCKSQAEEIIISELIHES